MAKSDTLETVLFDFDGTIADTLEQARLVVNTLSLEYGFKSVSKEDLVEMRKLTLNQLLKALGISKLQVPFILAKCIKLLKGKIDEVALINGMKEVIELARSRAKTVGILTSNSTENVELFLAKFQLSEYFDFIKSTSKLTSKAKSLRTILKQTDSVVDKTIYIGDEVRDIEACRKVGLPIIAVTWGFNAGEVLETLQPEHLVDTAAELSSILKSRFQ